MGNIPVKHHQGECQKRKKNVEAAKEQFNGFELWVFGVVYLKWRAYKSQEGIHSVPHLLASAHLLPGTIPGTCDSSLTSLVVL